MKNEHLIKYRVPSQYEGIYKYVAPSGYHWECMGDNFSNVIWGGAYLDGYPYVLVKNNNDEKMDIDITNNIDYTNNNNG